MVKVTVCIGSSCHIKGAREVVETFQELIKKNNVKAEVELGGTFCVGRCNEDGVSVTVDGDYYAVKPENAEEFFNEIVVGLIG
ncbi:MAG: hypothetical protein DBX59_05760 [Bacillota bacterium]|nr:MAG: hypothetical protein DBX59_05760 [Bacillota bacterium]